MSLRTLGLTSEGGLVTITLDRPEVANAIDLPMARELAAVTQLLTTTTGPRRCCWGPAGRTSAAVAILPASSPVTTSPRTSVRRPPSSTWPSPARRPRRPGGSGRPGVGLRRGLALACGCDLVVAAVSARFCVAYPGVGLSPDGGSSYSLPKMLGLRRALDLCLTGQVVGAEQASSWDWSVGWCPTTSSRSGAGSWRRPGRRPHPGPRATKRLLRQGVDTRSRSALPGDRGDHRLGPHAGCRQGLRPRRGRAPRFEGLDGPR